MWKGTSNSATKNEKGSEKETLTLNPVSTVIKISCTIKLDSAVNILVEIGEFTLETMSSVSLYPVLHFESLDAINPVMTMSATDEVATRANPNVSTPTWCRKGMMRRTPNCNPGSNEMEAVQSNS